MLIPVLTVTQAKSKKINYVDSDSEGTDNDEIFKSKPARRQPPLKRRKISESADEDVYEQENDVEEGEHEYPSTCAQTNLPRCYRFRGTGRL